MGNLDEVNREGRLAGRKLEIGMDLNDLAIVFDALAKAEGILAKK